MAPRRSKVSLALSNEEYSRLVEIARYWYASRTVTTQDLSAIAETIFLNGLMVVEMQRQEPMFDDSQ